MSFAAVILLLTWSFCVTIDISIDKYTGNKTQVCGCDKTNKNIVDLREPRNPGPFREITISELRQLRAFLERDPDIRAASPENATISSSYIFTADLLLPPKAEILRYLDKKGPKQIRKVRVIVLRGDKSPPQVEEYVCFPLPKVQKCELLNLASRSNPVNFNYRPEFLVEYKGYQSVFYEVDRQVGFILKESYGETFTNCTPKVNCLTVTTSAVGSGLIQDSTRRLTWLQAFYDLPFFELHPLNFAILLDNTGSDPLKWFVEKIWYVDRVFQDFDELIVGYNSNRISKATVKKPVDDENLFSSMRRRGNFMPRNPQRSPTLVEPDGKRYSVKDRRVTYLDWTFNFRMSGTTGPAVYDVRFKGQRIAHEISLSEVAVIYSGYSPFGRYYQKMFAYLGGEENLPGSSSISPEEMYLKTANFMDSYVQLGLSAKALVPGADCPDTATFVSAAFMSQTKSDPDVYETAFCLFENNNGLPLRRHMSYTPDLGSFYGGMLDSFFTLRSALTVYNYDYIVDFIFHQNGVLEFQVLSAGYILSVFYSTPERPYGYQVHENVLGNVHHHLFHVKVDLDIGGTSNRYETLDLQQELVNMTAFPDKVYSQTTFKANLKRSELEAVHDYNFETPKYHLVYNAADKNRLGEQKSYRIKMSGLSKNLMAEDVGNERSLSWARHQMVVTRHKDDQISSSSVFATYDSYRPTVDFTTFYEDNETIVDQDLVFWVTCGAHHIPQSEDMPTVATAGHHLSFAIMPFNYYRECPSMGSRDAIYLDHIDPKNPAAGVKVNRHGNTREQCLLPEPSLEADVAADPDRVLQSRTN